MGAQRASRRRPIRVRWPRGTGWGGREMAAREGEGRNIGRPGGTRPLFRRLPSASAAGARSPLRTALLEKGGAAPAETALGENSPQGLAGRGEGLGVRQRFPPQQNVPSGVGWAESRQDGTLQKDPKKTPNPFGMSGKLIQNHQRFMSKKETEKSCYFICIKAEIMVISCGVSQVVGGSSLLFILISLCLFPVG